MAIPPVRTSLRWLLIGAWWGLFCTGYFSRFPLPGGLADLYFCAVTVLILLSAAGYGWFLTRPLASKLFRAERILFALVAGLAALSLLMVISGVFGLWTKSGALGLVCIGLFL